MILRIKAILLFLVVLTLTMCGKKGVPMPKEEIAIQKRVIDIEKVSEIGIEDMQIYASALAGSSLSNKIKYPVKIVRLTYLSKYKGKNINLSGLIYLPVGITSPAPILSAQHGTLFNKADAPSLSKSMSGMEFLASLGYITLFPDYHGYGASSYIDHPYYDAEHAALSVTDMIYACKEYLKQEKIPFNNQLFLTGYSEGGFVTLAAQRAIETNPNTDLSITAVTAGAGGYDLSEMLKSVSTSNYYSYPAYLVFVLNSYNKVYDWNKSFGYFFNNKYAHKLDSLMQGNYDGGNINDNLTTNLDSLFNPVFFNNIKGSGELQFKKALVSNSLTNWSLKAPTHLYHGTLDEVVPFQNSEATIKKLLENGSKEVVLYPVKDGTHGSSLLPMIQSFIPWFESLKN